MSRAVCFLMVTVAWVCGAVIGVHLAKSTAADFCQSPLATVPGLVDAPPSAYMLPHAYGVKE